MKRRNILGLTMAIITVSMLFVACQSNKSDSGETVASSPENSTVQDDDKKADTGSVQTISGTITDIRDMQFVLEVGDTAYLFSYDSKPDDLDDDIEDGDTVEVSYTGELNDIDPFNGTIVSIEEK